MKLPLLFEERMQKQFEKEAYDFFLKAYENIPEQSIRLNTKKKASLSLNTRNIPWIEEGKILNQSTKFITDPLWHAGAYYVQESSSMILKNVIEQIHPNNSPLRALDLCAAPGGKSTLLQSCLDENSILIANEVIQSRASILKENHIRLGISENLIITRNDPKDFSRLKNFFDYIQVDAPCSGEGMFRKKPIAISEWSQANCDLCSSRQKRILSDIIPALARDGYLVYSTCTFNPEENEKNIHFIQKEFDLQSIPLKFNSDWNIEEVIYKGIYGYYFYPHRVSGEGLFVSVLKKQNGERLKDIKTSSKPVKTTLPECLNQNVNAITNNERLYWRSKELEALIKLLPKNLNIIYAGVELGEQKGKNFIPAQALANFHQQLHNYPSIELDKELALEYLRGNTPDLPLEEKGIYLATYQQLGLGWIKFLGNRINNNYPKSWRIRNY